MGVDVSLTDPATPVITLGAITNPTTCGGDGSIALSFSGVPNGIYSVSHSTGSFSGVVIASGTATISAPAGTYSDLQISANGCTSDLGVNATLTNPATPIITLGANTNPATCGGNGSIALSFSGTGTFPGVVITLGTATITAPAGNYTDLQITANGCSSDLGVDASLTDPATPVITPGAITNPGTCGGNGSIVLSFTGVSNGTYSVSHSTGSFPGVIIASGTATITAPAGTYTDLQITANGCTSDLDVDVSLTDPATPVITLGATTNPVICGGNGSIALSFSGVPNGTYSVSHNTGNFPGVVIASGTATITAPAGSNTNLKITANGCTSDLGVDVSLTDPATPVITLGAITNPATCGSNGSIALSFTGVPNGTYSVSYSAGNFPGIVITSGTATITAPAGSYTNLKITANGCTSDLGVDVSLTDPATPVITLGAITNPATCGGQGSIALSFTGVPNGTYSVSHSTGNFPGVVIASGTATIFAPAGSYTDLQIIANGCTSDLGVNATLSDPATPVITLGAITNPATCGGNGSIVVNVTNVTDGVYTISYTSSNFAGVTVTSGTVTISAPAGTYSDLQISANGCTSDLGVNATLTNPATPIITLGANTNPATCVGQGTIVLNVTNVPDGTYSVSHSRGNFSGVTVASGTATITAPAGTYTDLQVTANGCISDLDINATLTDPATPVITLGAITNPATCGGNGSIALSFSGVPNGTYTVSHSTGSFPLAVIASGKATISAPAGIYTDLQLTAYGCPSNTGINASIALFNCYPIAVNDTLSTPEDTPVIRNVLTNDHEPSSLPLSVSQFVVEGSACSSGTTAQIPGIGSLTISSAGICTFIPAANFHGSVPNANYIISNGFKTDTAVVSISILQVNDPPAANDDHITIVEDTQANGNVLKNDTDFENNTLSVTQFMIQGDPMTYAVGNTALIMNVGSIKINSNGLYVFTPTINYNGAVPLITYTITDGEGGTTSAMVHITVTPLNDPPVAVNDAFSLPENTEFQGDLIANDRDPDGDVITVTPVAMAPPLHGSVILMPDGKFKYKPLIDYIGSDSFVYELCDNGIPSKCTTATVSLTIEKDDQCEIYVPNSFSPNGDGIHENFKIRCLYNYANPEIKIYNRWGNLLYAKDHYGDVAYWGEQDAWWDGHSNNKLDVSNDYLPVGTYYYILKLDDNKVLTGFVFLNK